MKSVREVANLLHLTPYLDRKPPNYRVVSAKVWLWDGRFRARQPFFLMDEPLSNLDAALREEMRAEIKALHKN